MSKEDDFGKDLLEDLTQSLEKKTPRRSSRGEEEVDKLLSSTLADMGIDRGKLRHSLEALEREKKKERDLERELELALEKEKEREHREKEAAEERMIEVELPVEPLVEAPVEEKPVETLPPIEHLERIEIEKDLFPPRVQESVADKVEPERVEKPKMRERPERGAFPPLPEKRPTPPPPRPEPFVRREMPIPPDLPRKKSEEALFDAFAEKTKKPFPVVPVIIAAVVILGGAVGAFLFLGGGKAETPGQEDLLTQTSSAQPGRTEEQADLGQGTSAQVTATPIDSKAAAPGSTNASRTATETLEGSQAAPIKSTPPQTSVAAADPLVPVQNPRVQDVKPLPSEPPPTSASTADTQRPGAAAPQAASEATAKAKLGDLVPLEDVDTQPAPVRRTDAVYPPVAQRMGIEGTVIVNALISETGDVLRTSILRRASGNYGFEVASEEAVKRWKFSPAVKDGVNVKTWKAIAIVFKK